MIEGRQILIDGSLSLEGVRYFLVNAPAERQLQANDIVLRALVSPDARLYAAVVREDMLPLIASSSALVLRKKPDASVDERFLQEYLRSDRASEWVHAQGTSVSLPVSLLQEMPVPLPDETTASALEGLREPEPRSSIGDNRRNRPSARCLTSRRHETQDCICSPLAGSCGSDSSLLSRQMIFGIVYALNSLTRSHIVGVLSRLQSRTLKATFKSWNAPRYRRVCWLVSLWPLRRASKECKSDG